jgi:hypothetical protein
VKPGDLVVITTRFDYKFWRCWKLPPDGLIKLKTKGVASFGNELGLSGEQYHNQLCEIVFKEAHTDHMWVYVLELERYTDAYASMCDLVLES